MSGIVIIGAGGNLGQAVVTAFQQAHKNVVSLTRNNFDLLSPQARIIQTLDELNPDIIINCAAYTQVDKAEEEQELAFLVNARAPEFIAEWAATHNRYFIHFSTDYVFDGEKKSAYTLGDTPNPINVYGASKLAGELAVIDSAVDNAIVLRVSWVFGEHGKNFVPHIVNTLKTKQGVKAVTDQTGSPTYTRSVAELLVNESFLGNRPTGVYHANNAGSVSRYEQACFIAEAMGLKSDDYIEPITSTAFYTQARRPSNTAMVTSFDRLGHWQSATEEYLQSILEVPVA